jgi:hypothetical protein
MIVGSDPVLDLGAIRVECGTATCGIQTHDSETPTMIDPGTLGTLLIGLDRIRHEDDGSGPVRTRPTRRRDRGRRPTLENAASLRRLADRIEWPRRRAEFGL